MWFSKPKALPNDEGKPHKRAAEPSTPKLNFAQAKAKIILIREATRKIAEINQNVLQASTTECEDNSKKDIFPAVVSANNALALLNEHLLGPARSQKAPESFSLLVCMFADAAKSLSGAKKKLLADMRKKFRRQMQIIRPETTADEADILFMADDGLLGSNGLLGSFLLPSEYGVLIEKYKESVEGGPKQNDTALCLQNSIKDVDILIEDMMANFPILSATVVKRSFDSAQISTPAAEDKDLAVELLDAIKSGRSHTLVYMLNMSSASVLNYLHTTEEGWGYTALMYAASENSVDVINLFIQAGVDLNTRNERGFTAVTYAANQGCKEKNNKWRKYARFGKPNKLFDTLKSWRNEEAVKALAQAHADLNIQIHDGRTACMCAAGQGLLGVLKVLIEFSANLNVQDNDGDTALSIAVNCQLKDVVSALLNAGADRKIANKEGKTPAELPTSEEITLLFKDRGQTRKGSFMSYFLGTKSNDAPSPGAGGTAAPKTATQSTSKPPAPATPNSATLSPSVSTRGSPQPVSVVVGTPKQAITPPPVSVATPAPSPSADSPATRAASAAKPRTSIFGFGSPTAGASAQSTTSETPAQLTEQDKVALLSLSQATMHGRLNEVMLTVAAHDRALSTLVSKQKECPSLFWFYPKNRELRNWLSNPAKCLFQDSLMLVVVCPVTLCVVECGPKGVGWEVTMPKQWVKKWGPAIIFSIYVLQTAVLAGRIVGIPLPQLPSVADMTGLSSTPLGDTTDKLINQKAALKSLKSFAATTAAALDKKCPEVLSMCVDIQKHSDNDPAVSTKQPLPPQLPVKMMDETYKSIHTYLTTGDHAKLGKLEDQLRGRMERVLAENGNIEWVSVEGKDIWLEKNKLAKATTDSSVLVIGAQGSAPTGPVAPVAPASRIASGAQSSWLAVKLAACGVSSKHIEDCEVKLIEEQCFTSEELFAAYPPDEIHANYLRIVGISVGGLQVHLLRIYAELRAQYYPFSAAESATLAVPGTSAGTTSAKQPSNAEEAAFSKDEKDSLLKSVRTLTEELNRRQTTGSGAASGASGGASFGGSKGGLMQKQAQATAINPMTQQPYTMDELVEQLLRMEALLGRVDQKIDGVAAAADATIDQLRTEITPAERAGSDTKKSSWSLFSARK